MKAGDRVTLKVTPNGQYMNFDLPTKTDYLEARVDKIERIIERRNIREKYQQKCHMGKNKYGSVHIA